MDSLRRAPWLEIGIGALLVSAFVLPGIIGYQAWIPALALAIVLACATGYFHRRRPVVPLAMVAYVAIYALAGLLGDPDVFSLVEAGKYFAPPALALSVAWATLDDPSARRRVLVLLLAAIVVQVPVAVVQVIKTLIEYSADPIQGVDGIIGMLGLGAPGTLAQVGVFGGLILISAGYVRAIERRWAYVLGVALIALGALTSTRTSYVFVPVALGAIALLMWLGARDETDRSTRWLAVGLPVVLLATLVGLTGLLYPGANSPFSSRKQIEATAASTGVQSTQPDAPPVRTTTILPGRTTQLDLALELSTNDGVKTALVGRGIGATRFKSQAILDNTGTTTDRLTREEQQVNGIWVPRVIAETGFLGALAFFGLLLYMVLLSWRNRELIGRSASFDAAIMLVLPGIAALTLLSGFFNTVLAIQPYASVFWPLLGFAIAIDAERRYSNRAAQPSSD